jgi:bacterial/archaeal transporter family-2 protein
MQYGAMAATALVGATLAVQIGLNATMNRHVGSPIAAALLNFAVGTAVLLVIVLLGRGSLSLIGQSAAAPWWAWGAGVLGGIYVAASALFGPIVGGATFLAVLVAGQVLAALVLDHFGWLGFPERPLNVWRAVGACLVVAGMFLLARGK